MTFPAFCGENDFISSDGSICGHEYVDLGLPSGLLWATCDIGGNPPEKDSDHYVRGDCFAWGDITPYESPSYGIAPYYKWYDYSLDIITKYNIDSTQGVVDNKMILELSDDAAHVNWGGSWRMPTVDELRELVDNCTWTLTEHGFKATGPNGNSIFLYGGFIEAGEGGESGGYWSSTLDSNDSHHAFSLYLSDLDCCDISENLVYYSDYSDYCDCSDPRDNCMRYKCIYVDSEHRACGISVRPVSDPQK